MIGTMVLVLMGCGSAIFAGNAADACGAGVGTLGVALAFGLAVVAMAYAIGGISGCHINPAITLGVLLSGRMSGKDAAMYMVFQVIGAIIGSLILLLITAQHAPVQTLSPKVTSPSLSSLRPSSHSCSSLLSLAPLTPRRAPATSQDLPSA